MICFRTEQKDTPIWRCLFLYEVGLHSDAKMQKKDTTNVVSFLKDHNTIDAKHNSYLADGAYRI